MRNTYPQVEVELKTGSGGIFDVEANDDRLGILLTHLNDDTKWGRLERALWAATVAAYELVASGVRLDSTTVSGYHTRHEDGLMQLGHSKDHRPDLAQVKSLNASLAWRGERDKAGITSVVGDIGTFAGLVTDMLEREP